MAEVTEPTAQAGTGTTRLAPAPVGPRGGRPALVGAPARATPGGAAALRRGPGGGRRGTRAGPLHRRPHPSRPRPAWRPGCTRACWAGTPAGTRPSPAQGYGPLGHQSLRFFPAVPLLTHALAWVPGLGDGPALVLLANAAALAATAMLYRPGAARDRLGCRRPPLGLDPQPPPGGLRAGDGLRRVGPARVRPRLLPGPAARRPRPRPDRTSPWPACSPSRRP